MNDNLIEFIQNNKFYFSYFLEKYDARKTKTINYKILMDNYFNIMMNSYIKCTKDIILYRGITNKPLYKNKSFIQINYFLSTTIDEMVAEKFKDQRGYFIKIYVPEGSKICPIFNYSKIDTEKEVLLLYGSVFYVKDIDDDYKIIELVLIDGNEFVSPEYYFS
jgi:hypothetical protein